MPDHFAYHRQLGVIWDRGLKAYQRGHRQPEGFLPQEDLATLQQHGLNVMDVFDYVEDYCMGGDPDRETFLMIASIRRAYFFIEQKGLPTNRRLEDAALPSRDSELGGYRWLPRILAKAEAKLRGELESSIMYGCGGDRRFLKDLGIHPADFLHLVWMARGNTETLLNGIRLLTGKSESQS